MWPQRFLIGFISALFEGESIPVALWWLNHAFILCEHERTHNLAEIYTLDQRKIHQMVVNCSLMFVCSVALFALYYMVPEIVDHKRKIKSKTINDYHLVNC